MDNGWTIFYCGCAVAVFWFLMTAVGWFRARRNNPQAYRQPLSARAASAPQAAPQRPAASEDHLLAYRQSIRAEAERRAMERVADRHVQAEADTAYADFVGDISAPPPPAPPPVPNG